VVNLEVAMAFVLVEKREIVDEMTNQKGALKHLEKKKSGRD
jgi:hypothetical protein